VTDEVSWRRDRAAARGNLLWVFVISGCRRRHPLPTVREGYVISATRQSAFSQEIPFLPKASEDMISPAAITVK
jgi:hypothetical protein